MDKIQEGREAADTLFDQPLTFGDATKASLVGDRGTLKERQPDGTYKTIFPRQAGADVDVKTAKRTVSQCEAILDELRSGAPIVNNLESMQTLGTIRIGARVYDLRHGKYDGVEHPIVGDGTSENPYRLEK
jgi:hypothetical protein